MTPIDRPLLERFVDETSEELSVAKSRIISPKGYEPFEIWTHVGKSVPPGQQLKINSVMTDFRSRRRVVVNHNTEDVAIENHELFCYSKDSRFSAHIFQVGEQTLLRIGETQSDELIAAIDLTDIGKVVMRQDRAIMKFSNDAKKLAFLMYPKNEPPADRYVLTVVRFVQKSFDDFIDIQLEPSDVRSIVWTLDDKCIYYVSRCAENEEDAIFLYEYKKSANTRMLLYSQEIIHMEITPQGDKLLLFTCSPRIKEKNKSTTMVVWPLDGLPEPPTPFNGMEFRSVPERGWSNDGKKLVINGIYQSTPSMVVLDLENQLMKRVVRSLISTAFVLDYYDDELLVELHLPDVGAKKQLLLVRLPEKEWLTTAQIDDTIRVVREFDVVTSFSPNFKTHIIAYPKTKSDPGERPKSAGVLMIPELDEKSRAKIPLILMPHSGIGHQSLSNDPEVGVKLMIYSGYAVFLANYRHPTYPGFGTCRSLPGELHYGDSNDVKETLQIVLDKYPQLDSKQLYLLGQKYGAFVAARLLMQDKTKTFRAAAFIDPLLHFFCTCKFHTNMKAEAHEPILKSTQIKTPLMIIENADEKNSRDLKSYVEGLESKKIPNKLMKARMTDEKYIIDCLEWFAKNKSFK